MDRMIEFFGHIVGNPITRIAIKHTLKRDRDGVVKLDKFLSAYANGEDFGGLEFKVIRKIIDAGLKTFGDENTERVLKERL
ncbi:MAG: radical SAM/SPASM domain-containing protein, partial [Archaeoglobales archaeon]